MPQHKASVGRARRKINTKISEKYFGFVEGKEKKRYSIHIPNTNA